MVDALDSQEKPPTLSGHIATTAGAAFAKNPATGVAFQFNAVVQMLLAIPAVGDTQHFSR